MKQHTVDDRWSEDLRIVSYEQTGNGIRLVLENNLVMELDANEAGLIAHRFLGSRRIRNQITGAIKDTINQHGPIDLHNGLISSAAERVFSGLMGMAKQLSMDWGSMKDENKNGDKEK